MRPRGLNAWPGRTRVYRLGVEPGCGVPFLQDSAAEAASTDGFGNDKAVLSRLKLGLHLWVRPLPLLAAGKRGALPRAICQPASDTLRPTWGEATCIVNIINVLSSHQL